MDVRDTRAQRPAPRAWPARAASWWPWLPILFGVIWAVIFLADLRSDVRGIYTSSDIVSAPYIGELYHAGGAGAVVTLGNILWFPALFFELATKGLPAHREIWELAPYVLSLIGVGLVVWTVLRVAGRWAAAMTGATLGVASPYLTFLQFGWSIHSLTYVEVAVLGWFLVQSVTRQGQIGPPLVHWGLTLLVAAVTAVGLASDELLAFAGLIPFLAAALAVWWWAPRRGRAVAVSAIAVTVLGVAGGLLVQHAVTSDRIVASTFPINFTADNQVLDHLGLLVQSGFDMFSGGFGGQAIHAHSALQFLCAGVVVVAIGAGVAVGRTGVLAMWGAPRLARDAEPSIRLAFLAFWGLVALLTSAVYVFSSVAVLGTARYVVPAAYGLTAVLTTLAVVDIRRRVLVTVGVSLLTLSSVVGAARHELQPAASAEPGYAVAGQLARIAKANGLARGYAGYWDAAPLTWETKEAVTVYPVTACAATLCPFPFHQINTWYIPRPGTRTFLVSDPTQALNPTPPASLGKPQQTITAGQLTIYVYDYDIASKFG